MKFNKYIILILIVSLLSFSIDSTGVCSEETKSSALSPAGYEVKGESGNLLLLLNPMTAEFIVKNKSTGFLFYSNPQNREADKVAAPIYKAEMGATLIIEYSDTKNGESGKFNTLIECVNENSFKVKDIENGFRIDFYSKYYKLSIPFQVYLAEDSMKAEVLTKDIKIEDDAIKITSIQMLPYFGAAYNNQKGYIFVPDGSGAIINFNNGKKVTGLYSRPVYGKDIVESPKTSDLTTENIKAPVFGLTNGENAFFSVITDGDEEANINALVNGNRTSYSNVYAIFTTLAKMDYELVKNYATTVFEKGGIKSEKLGVKYFFLSDENANYSGMARKYRDYLITEEGFQPKLESGSALFIDLYAGVKKTKSFLGFKINIVQQLTTLNEAKAIFDELKDSGVSNIVARYNNWNKDEFNEKPLTNAKFSNGSNINIEKYINDLKKENTDFYPSVNRILTFRNPQNIFSTSFDIVKDLVGISVRRYDYDLGIGKRIGSPYYISKINVFQKNNNKLITSLHKRGFNNFAASDIGNTVFSEMGSTIYKKIDIKKTMIKTFESFQSNFDKILLENPNIYAAKFADDIINMPTSSSGQDLIDEDVPFLQIALNKIVRYSAPPINLTSDSNKMFLKTIETGSMPSFAWIYKDSVLLKNSSLDYLYSANYKTWIQTACEEYKEIDSIFKATENSKIFSHAKLNDGIYITRYENGLEVYVNYSDTDFQMENDKVVKSGKFLLLKAGE